MRRSPETLGQPGARWKLSTLLAACPWLKLHSLPGLSQLLRRLKIHWKRGRAHVHSPDPDYVAKLHDIHLQISSPESESGPRVFLFEDEFTLYRQPSLACAYEQAGHPQALAELGHKGNYTWRFAAAIHIWTGQVVYQQARYMDVEQMTHFYQKITHAFPGQLIYLAQDNWPVHYHRDLLAVLQEQSLAYPMHKPANWRETPRRKILHLQLPIQLFFLPTYASWTKPIEKLWRLLRQEVLHLHRYQDDWPALKQRVCTFLDQFATGSADLLRYVGLADPSRLYRAALVAA